MSTATTTQAAGQPSTPQYVTADQFAAGLKQVSEGVEALLKRPVPLQTEEADNRPRRKRRSGPQTPFQRFKADRARVVEADVHKGLGMDFMEVGLAHGLAAHHTKTKAPRSLAEQLAILGDEDLAHDWTEWERQKDAEEAQFKSLTTENLASGGALIAPEYGAEMITFLIAQQVLGRAGIRTMQTSAMEFVLGQATAGFTPAWKGEATAPAYTQGSSGQKRWQMRRLTATTAFSLQFVQTNFADATAYYRNLLGEQFALTADITFLRGPVSAYAPTGIKWQCPAATHLITQTGTSLANIVTDIFRLMGLLEDYNIPNTQDAVFIANPRTRRGIAQLRDGVGSFVFPGMQSMGDAELFGHRFLTTTNIPANLGGGGTETEWSILQPKEAMAVYLQTLMMKSSTDVAYTGAGGSLVSAWENDEVAVNFGLWGDIKLMHPEGFAQVTNSTI